MQDTSYPRESPQNPFDLRVQTALLAPTVERLAKSKANLVLLVLQDTGMRPALERFLRLYGFRPLTLETVHEAVEMIRRERPAAAVVDLDRVPAPGLDIAISMPLPRPVVLLSSKPDAPRELERLRPRTKLIQKPCSLLLLIETLQDMLVSAARVVGDELEPVTTRDARPAWSIA